MSDNKSEKIVRHGIVSNVDAESHRVRVTWSDSDNVVSAWLPVITPSASHDNIYILPDIDEEVVCVFESNDSEQGTAFASAVSTTILTNARLMI